MNDFTGLPRAAVMVCVAVLGGCGPEPENQAGESAARGSGATVTVSDASPVSAPAEATFQDLEGNPLEIGDFRGSKVFLNYWATWCAPCIREIPSINRAAAELEDEGFVFLFASDESIDTIRDFLAEREFEGRFIKLNSYFGEQGVEAVPSSVLYDASGKAVKTWLGAYEWDAPEMLEEIRAAE